MFVCMWFRLCATFSTWIVTAETRGPTSGKKHDNWCASSGTRSGSARRGVKPSRPKSEWLVEAVEGVGVVVVVGVGVEVEVGLEVFMEVYPHPTTQADAQVSPAWLCCTGRNSAAREAPRLPLTVSIPGIQSLNFISSTDRLPLYDNKLWINRSRVKNTHLNSGSLPHS